MLCYHGDPGSRLGKLHRPLGCTDFPGPASFRKEVLAPARAGPPARTQSSLLSRPPQNGNTALAIAKRLGYISVVDTLKVVTEEVTTTTTVSVGRRLRPRVWLSSHALFHLQSVSHL